MIAGSRPARRGSLAFLLLAVLIIAAAGYAAWTATFRLTIEQLTAEGDAELGFLTSALEKDLNRYKLLAKALSQTGTVRRRARFDFPDLEREAEDLLQRMASISGAEGIEFLTLSTAPDAPASQSVRMAYQGAIGLSFDPRAGGTFLVSAPVWIEKTVAGAVLVRVTSDTLEWSWRALPKIVFLTGQDGQIRLSSLPALRLRDIEKVAGPLDEKAVAPILWLNDSVASLAAFGKGKALILTQDVPVLDMKAYALIDSGSAERSGWLAAIAVSTTALALCMMVGAVIQQRASQRSRQRREARAKAELELRIADRTVELTAEIAERRLTEKRLRAMQDELVQAGKLSALGQMAAGIAHEINQPLAAIRSFAENATIYLQRGRRQEAEDNLLEIATLTDRAARIIKNLRAFARNQPEEMTEISVTDVIDDALSLMKARIHTEMAEIIWHPPAEATESIGGAVRLQQVVVNLIANALDAQVGKDSPKIEISVRRTAEQVVIIVRDHGPGLNEAARERMFDPFFSTKSEVGEGLGLGLSISYGIMRSFGGTLTGENHPDGGAIMKATLRASPADSRAA